MTGYVVELNKNMWQNVVEFFLDMEFHISFQSYVHLVFRDEKDPRTECEHWQYWHSQQPNPQQRAFDIGRLDHFPVVLVA